MTWQPQRLLAPNAGPMTLSGTNTWLLAPPTGPAVVIDPGPDDDGHLAAISAACPNGISQIWLTHHHLDHRAGAPELARRHGAEVRAHDPELCDRVLRDRETLLLGEREIEVRHLPGHTADSIGFVLRGPTGADFFSGDMVLGHGTTVIMHPDGDLGCYLQSLEQMLQLVTDDEVGRILPGHGPEVTDPLPWLRHYREHRQQRLQQLRRVLDQGVDSVTAVVEAIYGEVPQAVRPAATASTRAQLAHLGVRLSERGAPPALDR